MEIIAGKDSGTAQGPMVEVTAANFEAEVINASLEQPVIVDFWAPWCGPCRQLTPVLEKLAGQFRGKAKFVKINTDQNPDLAQALRIQSLPTVYAIYQGRPVDTFQGAVPESQARQFVERVIQAVGGGAGAQQAEALAAAVAQGEQAMAEGRPEEALNIFGQLVQVAPENPGVVAGMAGALAASGRAGEARKLLDQLPDELAGDAKIAAVRTRLDLLGEADTGDLARLKQAVESNPDDHQARYDLAMAQFAADDRMGAVETLIESIRRDRSWNEEASRKQLLRLFEAFGPSDPATLKGRRRLSALLFS